MCYSTQRLLCGQFKYLAQIFTAPVFDLRQKLFQSLNLNNYRQNLNSLLIQGKMVII